MARSIFALAFASVVIGANAQAVAVPSGVQPVLVAVPVPVPVYTTIVLVPVPIGVKVVTVADLTGFAIGEKIKIGTETAEITGVTTGAAPGGKLTLKEAVAEAHGVNARIVLSSPAADSVDTTLTAPTVLTSKVISVKSLTGFLAGNKIKLGTGTGAEERTIKAVTAVGSEGTMTLDSTFTKVFPKDDPVVKVSEKPAPVDTALTAAVIAGATSLSVEALTGFAVGDQITIGSVKAGDTIQTVTITGVTTGAAPAGSLTFEPPLANPHAKDVRVYWAKAAPAPGPTTAPTTLAAAAAATATEVVVVDSTGFAVGDHITIGTGTATAETLVIKGVKSAENKLFTETQLASAHLLGTTVYQSYSAPATAVALTSAAGAGTTALAVTSLTGYAVGDKITIDGTKTITGVSTGAAPAGILTVEPPLTTEQTVGTQIAFASAFTPPPPTTPPTTLAAATDAKATEVVVADSRGFAAGDHITVGKGTATAETLVIKGVNSAENKLLTETQLASAHLLGTTVDQSYSAPATAVALTSAAGAGTTGLAVADLTGYASGDKITIDGTKTITGVSTGAAPAGILTVEPPLTTEQAAGTQIGFASAFTPPTPTPTPTPTPAPTTVTTTVTPWDSSASSGSGSGDSSNSLNSNSFNTGSSASDSSGSQASSGSKASGSSGSYLPLWLWALLAALLCCCCLAGGGGAAAAMGGKKPKKRTTKKKPVAAPAPEPVVESEVEPLMSEVEPLITVPPLVPLATSSSLMPSYSMVSAPTTTAYAAPVTTAYAAPATTAYAAPATTAYAAPVTTAYAAPVTTAATTVYAAPATTAYAAPVTTAMPITSGYSMATPAIAGTTIGYNPLGTGAVL